MDRRSNAFSSVRMASDLLSTEVLHSYRRDDG